jgi:ABC-type antimicrobial peptide transport system permease subunit
MGVRRALGADGSSILTLVLKAGLRQVVPGLALGGGLAFLASRSLAAVLFRVEATFVAVTGVLLAVGLLATLVPAIRATRMDPVEALREE